MKGYVEARYEVENLRRFLDEFNAAKDLLSRFGFTRSWLHRDADNDSVVIVMHEAEDLDKARQFYKSDEFQQCRRKVGVGQPKLTFMNRLVPAPESAQV